MNTIFWGWWRSENWLAGGEAPLDDRCQRTAPVTPRTFLHLHLSSSSFHLDSDLLWLLPSLNQGGVGQKMANKDMMTQGVIPSKEGGLVLALVFKQVTFWGLEFVRRAYGSLSAGREKWPSNVLFFLKVEPSCDQTWWDSLVFSILSCFSYAVDAENTLVATVGPF